MKFLGLSALSLLLLTQQEVLRFRSSVEMVRLDVWVDASGRPVDGLTARDFELRDNDVIQKIEVLPLSDVPLHLFLVIDTSSSIDGEVRGALETALQEVASAARSTDAMTVIAFAGTMRVTSIEPGSTSPGALSGVVSGMTHGGRTALHDAIFAAMVLAEAEVKRRPLVVVFSDGEDTSSWLSASALLTEVSATTVSLHAIVGEPLWKLVGLRRQSSASGAEIRAAVRRSPDLLRTGILAVVTDISGGQFVVAGSRESLAQSFTQVLNAYRSGYLLSYTPQSEAPGWHALRVAVVNGKGRVMARAGYTRN